MIEKESNHSFGEWLPYGLLGLLLLLPYRFLQNAIMSGFICVSYLWLGGNIGYHWMKSFIYYLKYPAVNKWNVYLYLILCILLILNWIAGIYIMINIRKKHPL